ncbi:MAG: MarR family transcriptional regulator [Chlorobi bacterium]|nr:MarR family transcriptional regulator [Chlorobiota bacterium]
MSKKVEQAIVDDLNEVLQRFMREVFKAMHNMGNPLYEGLMSQDFAIIKAVNCRPDIILKDILDQLSIPNSTLTSIVNRLEKLDVLKRVISTRDRRSYGLELCEKGKLIIKDREEKENKYFTKILGALNSDEERQKLVSLLNTVMTNIDD